MATQTLTQFVNKRPIAPRNMVERRRILAEYGIELYQLKKKNEPGLQNTWINHVINESGNDIKSLTSILNKLCKENLGNMVTETKKLNYLDPGLVDIIFTKAVNEPMYSEVYATYCHKLPDLYPILNEMCSDQFIQKKHKNLSTFIGFLYNMKIIKNIDIFLEILMNELTEENLDIILELIKTQAAKKYKNGKIKQRIVIEKVVEPCNRIRCEVLIGKIMKLC